MLIKIIMAGTECEIGEKHCGFMQGRGCMDQVFALRQVCETYLANEKDVFIRLWIWKKLLIQLICLICEVGRIFFKFQLKIEIRS